MALVVADLVAEHIERWQMSTVERSVFGTADPAAVADELESFVETAAGSPVAAALFYGASVGCVLGVQLGDGRRVVIKAYQGRWGSDFLGAVRRIQLHLSNSGFPCPRPLLGPRPAGPALATVEEYVADPGMRVLETESEMELSAGGLARQIELCRDRSEPALGAHPLNASPGQLYPEPHNPIFDLTLDPPGAAWIDELAEAARSARDVDRSRPVIAHTDWSARNVRYDSAGVVVAYDWDSLSSVPESVAVGQAAATWRSTGEADPIAPDPDEVHAFVDAYGRCGAPFGADQRRAALASALWVLAYTARCEHAFEASTGRPAERARARLAKDGWNYLG